ncbi:alpha/beta hydrolase [Flexibacterium corallicola]|uniref:alpha/beta hydrolase n=1 Tax=Flexibacterium corallicola TaxID=3037259 RepID=UPI00286FA8D8|nr:alpha/beta hydrolase [Pseudovibrio sp. M1P-2-3]
MPSPFKMIEVDPKFTEEARQFNIKLTDQIRSLPDMWEFPPSVIRERQLQTFLSLTPDQDDLKAETITINGPNGSIELRYYKASSGNVREVYLHIHGGGFVFGSAAEHDPELKEIATNFDIDVVSIDYRLAPEYPYPHGPDDCEAAALWLLNEGSKAHGWASFAIGGESAGANLAVVTLMRLRDKHNLTPFKGTVLTGGFFDANLTPSARQWGDEPLVMTTRDIEMCIRHYLVRGNDPFSGDISPLYGKLHNLPPTLISVGTKDPLLDDSLFLASRMQVAGSQVDVEIYEQGCHVFQSFDLALAKISRKRIDTFLKSRMSSKL